MNIQKIKSILLALFVLGFNYSCQETIDNTENEQGNFPAVKHTSTLSSTEITEITNLINGSSLSEALDFESAQTAIYEEYEHLLMAFVPYRNNGDNYHVFSFSEGVLSDFHYVLENEQGRMSMITSSATVNYLFTDHSISDIEIVYSSLVSSGRSEECDVAGGFLDCTNAIQDQVRERVGAWGTFAFDIACGLWVVCRGAVVVGCTALAVAECAPVDDDSEK